MKGVSVQAYSSAGKASGTEINYDFSSNGGSTDIGTIVGYNEQTGILTLDASVALANNTTRAVGWRANGSSNTALDGYFVINASKTPTLSGISYVAPRVAYMKSVQAAGAGDGASIVGYQTRKLNTLDDASGIIQNPTSFTGTGGTNTQFQLASGEYNIDACAPAYVAERHNIRLRNVTSSTTVIVGSTERNTGGTVTQSCLSGRFTVTSASTFEIQHYIASASSPLGLGLETASGDVGVFTQVTLTKVK